MNSCHRVLIGFAESLAAAESAWSLVDAGYDVIAFTTQPRPALARSRHVKVFRITSPRFDAARAVADLVKLAQQHDVATVLPLDDEAVWLCDRAAADLPCPVAGPTGERAELALDKRRQLAAATAAGLAVPPTATIDDRAHCRPGPPTECGPWIVKPALAVWEQGGRLRRGRGIVADSESEMLRAVASVDYPLLVQPRLVGIGEGLFGHAGPHGVVAWSAHQRIRMMNPAGSGSSACRSADPDEQLVVHAQRFIDDAGWRGLFMLEFLRDSDGTAWFMELNGRTWGSMVLACRRGLAYPAWTVRSTLDEEFAPGERRPGPHITARNLGRELLHVAFVARGPRSDVADWPRLSTTLRSVLRVRRSERWYNARSDDLRVFAADTWQTIAAHARPARGGR